MQEMYLLNGIKKRHIKKSPKEWNGMQKKRDMNTIK